MGAPGTRDSYAVNNFRSGPAFRSPQDDQRPVRAAVNRAGLAGGLLDLPDVGVRIGYSLGEPSVHSGQVVALHLEHSIAMTGQQRPHFAARLAAQDRGTGDLRVVEVKDRKYGAVPGWIEEGDSLPRAFKGAGLSLTITDDGDRQEIWIVHDGAKGVHQDIAELAALVY